MNGLGRSLRLLRAFRLEQSEPERFYRVLAEDSVAQVSRHVDLRGTRVLDVGGGPGWFDDAFGRAGASHVVVERDPLEVERRRAGPAGATGGTSNAASDGNGPSGAGTGALTVAADGSRLPFADASFDVCFSSNVLEHVPDPWTMLEELARTVRPGGVVFVAFTNWLSPWGGHETSPWHLLGGERAARHYQRRRGHPPKNRYGRTLFPLHVGQVLRWARQHPKLQVVDARPRYYPDWCRPVIAVPGLRELVTWNLVTVLRRR